MNNAKLWLVVSPNVGIPIFLGGVAVASFAVHVATLSKTTWYEDYMIGAPLGSGEASAALATDKAPVAHASYAMPAADGGEQVLVVMPDGTTAMATLTPAVSVAH